MKFKELSLSGSYVIKQNRISDERGFFTRVFSDDIFNGPLDGRPIRQSNFSFSRYSGTTRGLHSQYAPCAEDKILFCPTGKLVNIIVDIRPNSPTFLKHEIIELSSENGLMTLVPKGFANGIQTLEDNTSLCYLVSEYYSPTQEIGLSIFDPKLDIQLPMKPTVISEKDKLWPEIDSTDFMVDFHKFNKFL